MNDDLYTLKVACYFIKDLKEDERKYNVALVKTAGKKLLEKRGWLGAALGAAGAALGTYYLATNGHNLARDFNIGLNYLNSDWGQRSVMEYANSGALNPEERNNYLIRRLSGSQNYNALRNRADAYMNANRETAYRNYKDWDANARGNRMIQQGVNTARNAYGNIRSGGTGYGYGYGGNYGMYRY